MYSQCNNLFCIILSEYFGEIVEKVGKDLLKYGQKLLRFIVRDTELSLTQVKEALCVMCKYGIVTFEPSKMPKAAEYTIHPEKILAFLRYPKYLLLMKTLYGDEAEIIMEEIFRSGRDTASKVLVKAYKRLIMLHSGSQENSTTVVSLRDTFETLVKKRYIRKCPTLLSSKNVPIFIKDQSDQFKPPKIDVAAIAQYLSGNAVELNEEKVYWEINTDRCHQDIRDDLLILAISRRVSPEAGEVLRMLLKQMYLNTEPWAACSNPIQASVVKDMCRKAKVDTKITRYLEEYLTVMAEDSCGFISKCIDTSALSYKINLKCAIEELTWCILAAAVEVKFGMNAARIFRVVKQERFVQQEVIQKKAMLPDKEAKLLTYSLLQAGWIQQQELRKGLPKSGPSKTFYLFHIDINSVVRMNIDACYKSLFNVISRREHEKAENKALLEKKQRIDAITLHMRNEGATDEQVAEIEEMITPPEHKLLEEIQSTVDKLSQSEFAIEDTLFILQLYLESQTECALK